MKVSLKSSGFCRGLTLLEMVIVLGVLGVVAGLITYSLNPATLTFSGVGNNETTAHIVTRSTMKSIQGAIIGNEKGPGFWSDMNKDYRMFPRDLASLFIGEAKYVSVALGGNPDRYALTDASATNLWTYNPRTGLGCRWPYLEASGHYIYGADATARNFTTSLFFVGLQDSPCPSDGWGNPIILLVPPQNGDPTNATKIKNNACLISAGPNGILDSNSAAARSSPRTYSDFLTARTFPLGDPNRFCQDDIVVFLFQPALP